MKQIICLSNEPWRPTPGRTQQLITRLRDAQVLYFAPAAPHDRSWRKPGREIRPGVTAYTLPPVLTQDERLGQLFHLGQRRIGRFIREQVLRHRFRDPLLWTACPVHIHLLDQLEYSGLVYDCDQAWDEFPAAWEGALAHAADVVFAASPLLREHLSPCSPNIALLPNGVNYPLFSGQTAPQKRQRRRPAPLLGWAGTVYADLDLSPLLYAAQCRPDWRFLLLGRREADNPWLRKLRRLPNVAIAGPCPLMEVPDYLGQCDVLLNFLRESQPDSDVVPGRLYEYLSTGTPIVSMLWPDQVERFPDVVYGADSPEELVRLCARALEEDRGWVHDRRRDYAAQAAWSQRSGEVQRILETAGLL